MANLYRCKLCNKDVAATLDKNGKEKVRGFRSGWVARFLDCGHIQPVTEQPIEPHPESEAA